MKSTILFLFFALICAVSSSLFAQQAEVILTNDERINGVINAKKFDQGILEIDNSSGIQNYQASSVKNIHFENGRVVESRQLIITKVDFTEETEHHFVEPLIIGEISLWWVYAEEISFALEKFNEIKALQVLTEKTLQRTNTLEVYKSILFQFASNCGETNETNNISLSKSQLIIFVNTYNACVDANYQAQLEDQIEERVFELSVGYGNAYSDLSFTASTIIARVNTEYEIDYKTSITNYYSSALQAGILSNYLFIGLGVQLSEYEFNPDLDEVLVSGTSFLFSEMIFTASAEFQYPINRLVPAIKLGYNNHSITKDYDKAITARIRDDNSRIGEARLTLKDDERELSASYSTFSVSPSLSFMATKTLVFGITYSLHTNNENFLSLRRETAQDKRSLSFFGAFAKMRFISIN